MKANILVLFFVLLVIEAKSQKAPIKFGDVSINDLKMTRYDPLFRGVHEIMRCNTLFYVFSIYCNALFEIMLKYEILF